MAENTTVSSLPMGEGWGTEAASGRRTLNPYVQVALTYLHRLFSTWQGRMTVFIVLLLGLPAALVSEKGGTHHDIIVFRLAPFVFLFLYLAVHIKDQFADSRARLTPGFRYTHTTIAVAAVLFCAVFLPAMFTWIQGWYSIGFVACAVVLFGVTLWMVLSPWLGLLVAVGWFPLMMEPANSWLRQLVSGRSEPWALSILVCGMIVALLGAFRLVRLDEDMPAYHRRIQWGWTEGRIGRQTWAGEGRALPWLWDWLAARQVANLARHARRASRSQWSGICRWQVGIPNGWSALVWVLGAVLYMHCLTWVLPPNKQPTVGGLSIGLISFCFTVVPMIALLGPLLRRIPIFGYELMMPVARGTYLKQFIAAAAMSCFQLWAGTCIALVFWWLLVAAQPPQFDKMAIVVVVSGACLIWLFGMFAWLASFRSKVWAILPGALVLPTLLVLMERMEQPATEPHVLIMLIVGILAVLGLLLTYVAYRRWLCADFD